MTEAKDTLLDRFGRWIAGRLQEESSGYEPYTPSDAETLRRTLEPGDILLIEGNQRISAVIKYLTQSTWSHSALYVGDALAETGGRVGASAPDRGQSRRGLRRGAAQQIPHLQHTHLPAARPDAGRPLPGREFHDRAHRPQIRSQEHSRHAALSSFPRLRCRCAGAAACWPSDRATRHAPSARP